MFEIHDVIYGDDQDEAADPPPKSERRARLGKVIALGTTFDYIYDFGDEWRHQIVVERILAPERGSPYPACVAGGRASPPEDSGAAHRYTGFLPAIGDPSHPDHDGLLQWAGGSFDPEACDVAEVNLRLRMTRLLHTAAAEP